MIVIPERETPGRERGCLGEPDCDRLAEAKIADLPLPRHAVGEPEEHAEDGQEDRDLPGLPEAPFDDALAQRAPDRGRDRRREDTPRGPLFRVRISLWPTLRNQAATSATMSSQKQATTAISVPG